MTTTTADPGTRRDSPEIEAPEVFRDDFLVLIHKALRYGLLKVTMETGAADWSEPACVEQLRGRWDSIERLIRSHAGHEDRYIFALLEIKHPGAVEELGIGHSLVERELDEVSAKMRLALETRDPVAGLDAYRALAHLVSTALAHFADEEPVVMERIWESSTDEEIAACRAAFMAEITPEEATATYELMFPAIALDDLVKLLSRARDGVPEPVFMSLLEVAEGTLTATAWARLRERVGVQGSAVGVVGSD